ncbi:exodeoxyribonuclease III [Candidatus Albibeggiatoa sp. nov. NOAA]|uniref:exodeoxyribonuclease III n=1 Tax=Candidatus Albibeggiatoa sp. nov. NOAA TaxID=3162724 RepID=UPI0032F88829|nr:exodeoxyribonuclease III [Thiotrichaceae bacterium]
MFTIATWNVNSLRVRLPHVIDWLQDKQPDVLALQEIKLTDDVFPSEALQEIGYQAVFAGQKTYNGVALLSREPATNTITDFPSLDDPQRRVLGANFGDIRVLNLYVPNGSEVGSEKYAYKLNWLQHLYQYVQAEREQHEKMIILGDFNIAPDDRDVHDPEAWQDSILVSPEEREALQKILDLGFHDSFRLFESEAGHFSWWDYRAAAFRRNRGVRIDLILASDALKPLCASCDTDVEPRKLERPSDHAPVLAQFDC